MGLMSNGFHVNGLNFHGGQIGGLNTYSKGVTSGSISNSLTYHNKYVSFPYGYYNNALLLPISYGGIGATIKCSSNFTGNINALANLNSNLMGLGLVQPLNLIGGYNLEALLEGFSYLVSNIQAKANLNANIKIGSTPSADDIVYTLMDTPTGNVENNMSLRDTLKVLLSVMAGKTQIDTNNAIVKFRDINDTKDRITTQMSGSERIDVTINKT